MSEHETPLSPDRLLRRAARGDADRAAELLAYVTPTKLLDAVLTQAELAIDEGRIRPAGIDAIAELDRASIEVMDLPQGADIDIGGDRAGPRELADDELREAVAGRFDWLAHDERLLEAPVLIGWELTTVAVEDLAAAVGALTVRPWHLVLVAFADRLDATGSTRRVVTAAAADGRLVAATLRFTSPADDPDVLAATVTWDSNDLDSARGQLATRLRTALVAAARGMG